MSQTDKNNSACSLVWAPQKPAACRAQTGAPAKSQKAQSPKLPAPRHPKGQRQNRVPGKEKTEARRQQTAWHNTQYKHALVGRPWKHTNADILPP